MDEWRRLLRDARIALNMPRRELAESAHVSEATLKAYESGLRQIGRAHV